MAFGDFKLSSISWRLGDRTKTHLFSRYMPSYSTRLKYESETWSVLPPSSADPMGAVDPVWTESNWNTISLRVYSVQGTTYDHLILVAGVVVTALSYLLIVIVKALIAKALKQD